MQALLKAEPPLQSQHAVPTLVLWVQARGALSLALSSTTVPVLQVEFIILTLFPSWVSATEDWETGLSSSFMILFTKSAYIIRASVIQIYQHFIF